MKERLLKPIRNWIVNPVRWFITSLRLHLLLWLLPATLLVGIIASSVSYFIALYTLDDLFNDQMEAVAKYLTVSRDGTFALTRPDKLSGQKPDRLKIQVWRGSRLEFSSTPFTTLPPPTTTGLATINVDGQQWLTYVSGSGDTMIRVAQVRQARFLALAEIAIHLFWPVLSLIPVLAVFLWFGIGYGLKPLKKIATGLSRRDASDMAPITVPTMPSEVKPLADAINDLLRRLDQAFTVQKQFIADASHELRTPIMGLSIQSQLLSKAATEEERQKIMSQIEKGAEHLAHLTEQLLTLARLSPDAWEPDIKEIDVTQLAREVITDRARLAALHHIDLGLVSTEPQYIQGSVDDLRILLNNLVDNAIRYAGKNAQVDVVTRRQNEWIVLEVSDNGPGIPETDRYRIWGRFYRGANPAIPGSGLGLSIVKQIADQHGATLALDSGINGQGVTFRVCFLQKRTIN